MVCFPYWVLVIKGIFLILKLGFLRKFIVKYVIFISLIVFQFAVFVTAIFYLSFILTLPEVEPTSSLSPATDPLPLDLFLSSTDMSDGKLPYYNAC